MSYTTIVCTTTVIITGSTTTSSIATNTATSATMAYTYTCTVVHPATNPTIVPIASSTRMPYALYLPNPLGDDIYYYDSSYLWLLAILYI